MVNKKEILEKVEQLKDGNRLLLRLGPTFGSGVAIVEANPAYPQKGQKKYLMRWAQDEATAKGVTPLISTDKAKQIAGWLADRGPEWIV